MPLPLYLLPGEYAIVRLDPQARLPEWVHGAFTAVVRTADELSIVCPSFHVPSELEPAAQSAPWRCFQVRAVLDFSLIGVLASLLNPLAECSVSVFTVSTFNTDYVLVRSSDLKAALDALTAAGHEVSQT